MRFYTVTFIAVSAVFSSLSLPVLATSCGVVPQPPALLAQPQITLVELKTLQTQMSVYTTSMDAYVDCEERSVGAITIDTSGMTEEFVQSEAFLATPEYQAYQSQVDVINARIDSALAEQETNIANYNAHVVSAAPADTDTAE